VNRGNWRVRAENSILRFLVECCEEGPELESSGIALDAAYSRFWRQCNIDSIGKNDRELTATYLHNGTLYKLLVESGFVKETRESRGPKGGTFKTVWFKGVAPKDLPEPAPLSEQYPNTEEDENGDVPARPPARAARAMRATHVRINGMIYERDMIATVRPIRGFVKANTGETMKAIVTFNNAELRHQFVTAEEAERIEAQLTGEEVR
jgi:hypothetical protein